ncbi:hypothetical protein [Pseudarthrobacter sulfonivorans]|uniref:hypothetical protein n=1 Tax=Pseudarthrobacter sulfonivorans TaxID=121292 RepID=UPI000AF81C28|nr:hypothetical protein [Pseudarthrobacter sulfonivorans]
MSKNVFSGWDPYARKALWGPAGIAIIPAVILSAYWVPSFVWVGTGVSLAVSFGLTIALAECVRPLGRRTQERLIEGWGGFPTTQALRFANGTHQQLRKQRRRHVEMVSGHTLPTKSEERSKPNAADERYEHAVYAAIALMREGGVDIERLNSENVSYGFRRNTRALKAIALVILAVAGLANLYLMAAKGALLIGGSIAVLDLLAMGFWIIVVRDRWVTEQAEIYATRFFISADVTATQGRVGSRR